MPESPAASAMSQLRGALPSCMQSALAQAILTCIALGRCTQQCDPPTPLHAAVGTAQSPVRASPTGIALRTLCQAGVAANGVPDVGHHLQRHPRVVDFRDRGQVCPSYCNRQLLLVSSELVRYRYACGLAAAVRPSAQHFHFSFSMP